MSFSTKPFESIIEQQKAHENNSYKIRVSSLSGPNPPIVQKMPL